MKIVIALKGKQNTGKTWILNLLVYKLIEKEYECDILMRGKKEIVAKFNINGRRIIISSSGDTVPILKKIEYKYIENKNIDIWVCACHPGKIANYLESKYQNVVFVENFERNTIKSTIAKYNNSQVSKLIKQILTIPCIKK